MISPSRPRRALAASIAVTALLAVAACTGSDKPKKSSSASESSAPSTSTSPSAVKPPPKPALKNPFTGIGPVPKTPVIAVKIDDTPPGRPQVGIDKADVVYIEAAEGGLTRLAAIFATHTPTVGYVRSTRPSDPDLLLQYGKITEAYSGGAHDSLPRVRESGITSWSNDAGAPYYSRVSRFESDYINLVLDLNQVAHKTRSPRPKSIGWTFQASDAGLPHGPGTDVRTTVAGQFGAGTPVEFRYSYKLKKYIRYINGVRQVAADGNPIATTNVIIQYCNVVSHPADSDVLGNPSQFTNTLGKGKVIVFRHGKRINGTWSRAGKNAGTVLRTTGGKALPLAPGNTWVALVRKGIPTTGS